MNRRTPLTILLLIPIMLLANVGGVWKQEAVHGVPYLSANTGIAVEKEIIDLTFYEEENRVKCRFTARYYFHSSSSDIKEIIGQFYGVDSRDVVIHFNGEEITCSGDPHDLHVLDSLMEMNFTLATPVSIRNRPLDEQRELAQQYGAERDSLEKKKSIYRPLLNGKKLREDLCKTPFQLEFSPENGNILTVSGILEPRYDDSWGLDFAPSVWSRHPFRNDYAGKHRASVTYLLRPIEKWERVGEIKFNIRFPKEMEIYSTLFNRREYYNQLNLLEQRAFEHQSIQTEKSETDTEIRYTGSFTEGFPDRMDFIIMDKPQIFFPGGPKIGFGKNNNSSSFTMRYGWEAAVELGVWDLLLSLDYDTDYSNHHVAAFTTDIYLPFIFNIGVGAGIPVDLVEKEAGVRFNIGSHILLLGFVCSLDYFPATDRLQSTLLGQITF